MTYRLPKKFGVKATALLIAALFIWETAAWAAPAPINEVISVQRSAISDGVRSESLVEKIQIPSSLGSVQEVFQSPVSGLLSLVHLEDAHGEPEAQKNTQAILEHLQKEYGIQTFFLEGAWSRLEAGRLRFSENEKTNQKILEQLTEKGIVGGPENFLYGNSRYSAQRKSYNDEAQGYGIEDLELYKKNLQQFRAVIGAKAQSEAFLNEMKAGLLTKASQVLNSELADYFRQWSFHEEVQSDYAAHFRTLAENAKKHLALDLGDAREQYDWPQLVRFFKLKELEKDKGQRTKDKEAFIEWLGKNKLIKLKECFEPETLFLVPCSLFHGDARKFFENFYEQASPKGFKFKDYPGLSKQWGKQILAQELDAPLLIKEIQSLENTLIEKLAQTPDEKKFIQKYREYLLLKKLLHLELSRSEWRGLDPNAASVPDPYGAIIKNAQAFYQTAEARDIAMLKRTIDWIKKEKIEKAAIITGGYHSEGLGNLFKQKNISYLRIQPRITKITGRENYFKLMMTGKSALRAGSLEQPGVEILFPQFADLYRGNAAMRGSEETGGKLKARTETAKRKRSENRVGFISSQMSPKNTVVQWTQSWESYPDLKQAYAWLQENARRLNMDEAQEIQLQYAAGQRRGIYAMTLAAGGEAYLFIDPPLVKRYLKEAGDEAPAIRIGEWVYRAGTEKVTFRRAQGDVQNFSVDPLLLEHLYQTTHAFLTIASTPEYHESFGAGDDEEVFFDQNLIQVDQGPNSLKLDRISGQLTFARDHPTINASPSLADIEWDARAALSLSSQIARGNSEPNLANVSEAAPSSVFWFRDVSNLVEPLRRAFEERLSNLQDVFFNLEWTLFPVLSLKIMKHWGKSSQDDLVALLLYEYREFFTVVGSKKLTIPWVQDWVQKNNPNFKLEGKKYRFSKTAGQIEELGPSGQTVAAHADPQFFKLMLIYAYQRILAELKAKTVQQDVSFLQKPLKRHLIFGPDRIWIAHRGYEIDRQARTIQSFHKAPVLGEGRFSDEQIAPAEAQWANLEAKLAYQFRKFAANGQSPDFKLSQQADFIGLDDRRAEMRAGILKTAAVLTGAAMLILSGRVTEWTDSVFWQQAMRFGFFTAATFVLNITGAYYMYRAMTQAQPLREAIKFAWVIFLSFEIAFFFAKPWIASFSFMGFGVFGLFALKILANMMVELPLNIFFGYGLLRNDGVARRAAWHGAWMKLRQTFLISQKGWVPTNIFLYSVPIISQKIFPGALARYFDNYGLPILTAIAVFFVSPWIGKMVQNYFREAAIQRSEMRSNQEWARIMTLEIMEKLSGYTSDQNLKVVIFNHSQSNKTSIVGTNDFEYTLAQASNVKAAIEQFILATLEVHYESANIADITIEELRLLYSEPGKIEFALVVHGKRSEMRDPLIQSWYEDFEKVIQQPAAQEDMDEELRGFWDPGKSVSVHYSKFADAVYARVKKLEQGAQQLGFAKVLVSIARSAPASVDMPLVLYDAMTRTHFHTNIDTSQHEISSPRYISSETVVLGVTAYILAKNFDARMKDTENHFLIPQEDLDLLREFIDLHNSQKNLRYPLSIQTVFSLLLAPYYHDHRDFRKLARESLFLPDSEDKAVAFALSLFGAATHLSGLDGDGEHDLQNMYPKMAYLLHFLKHSPVAVSERGRRMVEKGLLRALIFIVPYVSATFSADGRRSSSDRFSVETHVRDLMRDLLVEHHSLIQQIYQQNKDFEPAPADTERGLRELLEDPLLAGMSITIMTQFFDTILGLNPYKPELSMSWNQAEFFLDDTVRSQPEWIELMRHVVKSDGIPYTYFYVEERLQAFEQALDSIIPEWKLDKERHEKYSREMTETWRSLEYSRIDHNMESRIPFTVERNAVVIDWNSSLFSFYRFPAHRSHYASYYRNDTKELLEALKVRGVPVYVVYPQEKGAEVRENLPAEWMKSHLIRADHLVAFSTEAERTTLYQKYQAQHGALLAFPDHALPNVDVSETSLTASLQFSVRENMSLPVGFAATLRRLSDSQHLLNQLRVADHRALKVMTREENVWLDEMDAGARPFQSIPDYLNSFFDGKSSGKILKTLNRDLAGARILIVDAQDFDRDIKPLLDQYPGILEITFLNQKGKIFPSFDTAIKQYRAQHAANKTQFFAYESRLVSGRDTFPRGKFDLAVKWGDFRGKRSYDSSRINPAEDEAGFRQNLGALLNDAGILLQLGPDKTWDHDKKLFDRTKLAASDAGFGSAHFFIKKGGRSEMRRGAGSETIPRRSFITRFSLGLAWAGLVGLAGQSEILLQAQGTPQLTPWIDENQPWKTFRQVDPNERDERAAFDQSKEFTLRTLEWMINNHLPHQAELKKYRDLFEKISFSPNGLRGAIFGKDFDGKNVFMNFQDTKTFYSAIQELNSRNLFSVLIAFLEREALGLAMLQSSGFQQSLKEREKRRQSLIRSIKDEFGDRTPLWPNVGAERFLKREDISSGLREALLSQMSGETYETLVEYEALQALIDRGDLSLEGLKTDVLKANARYPGVKPADPHFLHHDANIERLVATKGNLKDVLAMQLKSFDGQFYFYKKIPTLTHFLAYLFFFGQRDLYVRTKGAQGVDPLVMKLFSMDRPVDSHYYLSVVNDFFEGVKKPIELIEEGLPAGERRLPRALKRSEMRTSKTVKKASDPRIEGNVRKLLADFEESRAPMMEIIERFEQKTFRKKDIAAFKKHVKVLLRAVMNYEYTEEHLDPVEDVIANNLDGVSLPLIVLRKSGGELSPDEAFKLAKQMRTTYEQVDALRLIVDTGKLSQIQRFYRASSAFNVSSLRSEMRQSPAVINAPKYRDLSDFAEKHQIRVKLYAGADLGKKAISEVVAHELPAAVFAFKEIKALREYMEIHDMSVPLVLWQNMRLGEFFPLMTERIRKALGIEYELSWRQIDVLGSDFQKHQSEIEKLRKTKIILIREKIASRQASEAVNSDFFIESIINFLRNVSGNRFLMIDHGRGQNTAAQVHLWLKLLQEGNFTYGGHPSVYYFKDKTAMQRLYEKMMHHAEWAVFLNAGQTGEASWLDDNSAFVDPVDKNEEVMDMVGGEHPDVGGGDDIIQIGTKKIKVREAAKDYFGKQLEQALADNGLIEKEKLVKAKSPAKKTTQKKSRSEMRNERLPDESEWKAILQKLNYSADFYEGFVRNLSLQERHFFASKLMESFTASAHKFILPKGERKARLLADGKMRKHFVMPQEDLTQAVVENGYLAFDPQHISENDLFVKDIVLPFAFLPSGARSEDWAVGGEHFALLMKNVFLHVLDEALNGHVYIPEVSKIVQTSSIVPQSWKRFMMRANRAFGPIFIVEMKEFFLVTLFTRGLLRLFSMFGLTAVAAWLTGVLDTMKVELLIGTIDLFGLVLVVYVSGRFFERWGDKIRRHSEKQERRFYQEGILRIIRKDGDHFRERFDQNFVDLERRLLPAAQTFGLSNGLDFNAQFEGWQQRRLLRYLKKLLFEGMYYESRYVEISDLLIRVVSAAQKDGVSLIGVKEVALIVLEQLEDYNHDYLTARIKSWQRWGWAENFIETNFDQAEAAMRSWRGKSRRLTEIASLQTALDHHGHVQRHAREQLASQFEGAPPIIFDLAVERFTAKVAVDVADGGEYDKYYGKNFLPWIRGHFDDKSDRRLALTSYFMGGALYRIHQISEGKITDVDYIRRIANAVQHAWQPILTEIAQSPQEFGFESGEAVWMHNFVLAAAKKIQRSEMRMTAEYRLDELLPAAIKLDGSGNASLFIIPLERLLPGQQKLIKHLFNNPHKENVFGLLGLLDGKGFSPFALIQLPRTQDSPGSGLNYFIFDNANDGFAREMIVAYGQQYGFGEAHDLKAARTTRIIRATGGFASAQGTGKIDIDYDDTGYAPNAPSMAISAEAAEKLMGEYPLLPEEEKWEQDLTKNGFNVFIDFTGNVLTPAAGQDFLAGVVAVLRQKGPGHYELEFRGSFLGNFDSIILEDPVEPALRALHRLIALKLFARLQNKTKTSSMDDKEKEGEFFRETKSLLYQNRYAEALELIANRSESRQRAEVWDRAVRQFFNERYGFTRGTQILTTWNLAMRSRMFRERLNKAKDITGIEQALQARKQQVSSRTNRIILAGLFLVFPMLVFFRHGHGVAGFFLPNYAASALFIVTGVFILFKFLKLPAREDSFDFLIDQIKEGKLEINQQVHAVQLEIREQRRKALREAFEKRDIKILFLDMDGNLALPLTAVSKRAFHVLNRLLALKREIHILTAAPIGYAQKQMHEPRGIETSNRANFKVAAESGGVVATMAQDGRILQQVAPDITQDHVLTVKQTLKDVLGAELDQGPHPDFEEHFPSGLGKTTLGFEFLGEFYRSLALRKKQKLERELKKLAARGVIPRVPTITVSSSALDISFFRKGNYVDETLAGKGLTEADALSSGDSAGRHEGVAGGDRSMFVRVSGERRNKVMRSIDKLSQKTKTGISLYSGPEEAAGLPLTEGFYFNPVEGPEGTIEALEILAEVLEERQRSEIRSASVFQSGFVPEQIKPASEALSAQRRAEMRQVTSEEAAMDRAVRTHEIYFDMTRSVAAYQDAKGAGDAPKQRKLLRAIKAWEKTAAELKNEIRFRDSENQAKAEEIAQMKGGQLRDEKQRIEKDYADVREKLLKAEWSDEEQSDFKRLSGEAINLLKLKALAHWITFTQALQNPVRNQNQFGLILFGLLRAYSRIAAHHAGQKRVDPKAFLEALQKVVTPQGTVEETLDYSRAPFARIRFHADKTVTIAKRVWKYVDVKGGPEALIAVWVEITLNSAITGERLLGHEIEWYRADYAALMQYRFMLDRLIDEVDAWVSRKHPDDNKLPQETSDSIDQILSLILEGVSVKGGKIKHGMKRKFTQLLARKNTDVEALPKPGSSLKQARIFLKQASENSLNDLPLAAAALKQALMWIDFRLEDIAAKNAGVERELYYLQKKRRQQEVRAALSKLWDALASSQRTAESVKTAVDEIAVLYEKYYRFVIRESDFYHEQIQMSALRASLRPLERMKEIIPPAQIRGIKKNITAVRAALSARSEMRVANQKSAWNISPKSVSGKQDNAVERVQRWAQTQVQNLTVFGNRQREPTYEQFYFTFKQKVMAYLGLQGRRLTAKRELIRPMLVLESGAPGSGKSHVQQEFQGRIAQDLGLEQDQIFSVSTDEVLLDTPPPGEKQKALKLYAYFQQSKFPEDIERLSRSFNDNLRKRGYRPYDFSGPQLRPLDEMVAKFDVARIPRFVKALRSGLAVNKDNYKNYLFPVYDQRARGSLRIRHYRNHFEILSGPFGQRIAVRFVRRGDQWQPEYRIEKSKANQWEPVDYKKAREHANFIADIEIVSPAQKRLILQFRNTARLELDAKNTPRIHYFNATGKKVGVRDVARSDEEPRVMEFLYDPEPIMNKSRGRKEPKIIYMEGILALYSLLNPEQIAYWQDWPIDAEHLRRAEDLRIDPSEVNMIFFVDGTFWVRLVRMLERTLEEKNRKESWGDYAFMRILRQVTEEILIHATRNKANYKVTSHSLAEALWRMYYYDLNTVALDELEGVLSSADMIEFFPQKNKRALVEKIRARLHAIENQAVLNEILMSQKSDDMLPEWSEADGLFELRTKHVILKGAVSHSRSDSAKQMREIFDSAKTKLGGMIVPMMLSQLPPQLGSIRVKDKQGVRTVDLGGRWILARQNTPSLEVKLNQMAGEYAAAEKAGNKVRASRIKRKAYRYIREWLRLVYKMKQWGYEYDEKNFIPDSFSPMFFHGREAVVMRRLEGLRTVKKAVNRAEFLKRMTKAAENLPAAFRRDYLKAVETLSVPQKTLSPKTVSGPILIDGLMQQMQFLNRLTIRMQIRRLQQELKKESHDFQNSSEWARAFAATIPFMGSQAQRAILDFAENFDVKKNFKSQKEKWSKRVRSQYPRIGTDLGPYESRDRITIEEFERTLNKNRSDPVLRTETRSESREAKKVFIEKLLKISAKRIGFDQKDMEIVSGIQATFDSESDADFSSKKLTGLFEALSARRIFARRGPIEGLQLIVEQLARAEIESKRPVAMARGAVLPYSLKLTPNGYFFLDAAGRMLDLETMNLHISREPTEPEQQELERQRGKAFSELLNRVEKASDSSSVPAPSKAFDFSMSGDELRELERRWHASSPILNQLANQVWVIESTPSKLWLGYDWYDKKYLSNPMQVMIELKNPEKLSEGVVVRLSGFEMDFQAEEALKIVLAWLHSRRAWVPVFIGGVRLESLRLMMGQWIDIGALTNSAMIEVHGDESISIPFDKKIVIVSAESVRKLRLKEESLKKVILGMDDGKLDISPIEYNGYYAGEQKGSGILNQINNEARQAREKGKGYIHGTSGDSGSGKGYFSKLIAAELTGQEIPNETVEFDIFLQLDNPVVKAIQNQAIENNREFAYESIFWDRLRAKAFARWIRAYIDGAKIKDLPQLPEGFQIEMLDGGKSARVIVKNAWHRVKNEEGLNRYDEEYLFSRGMAVIFDDKYLMEMQERTEDGRLLIDLPVLLYDNVDSVREKYIARTRVAYAEQLAEDPSLLTRKLRVFDYVLARTGRLYALITRGTWRARLNVHGLYRPEAYFGVPSPIDYDANSVIQIPPKPQHELEKKHPADYQKAWLKDWLIFSEHGFAWLYSRAVQLRSSKWFGPKPALMQMISELLLIYYVGARFIDVKLGKQENFGANRLTVEFDRGKDWNNDDISVPAKHPPLRTLFRYDGPPAIDYVRLKAAIGVYLAGKVLPESKLKKIDVFDPETAYRLLFAPVLFNRIISQIESFERMTQQPHAQLKGMTYRHLVQWTIDGQNFFWEWDKQDKQIRDQLKLKSLSREVKEDILKAAINLLEGNFPPVQFDDADSTALPRRSRTEARSELRSSLKLRVSWLAEAKLTGADQDYIVSLRNPGYFDSNYQIEVVPANEWPRARKNEDSKGYLQADFSGVGVLEEGTWAVIISPKRQKAMPWLVKFVNEKLQGERRSFDAKSNHWADIEQFDINAPGAIGLSVSEIWSVLSGLNQSAWEDNAYLSGSGVLGAQASIRETFYGNQLAFLQSKILALFGMVGSSRIVPQPRQAILGWTEKDWQEFWMPTLEQSRDLLAHPKLSRSGFAQNQQSSAEDNRQSFGQFAWEAFRDAAEKKRVTHVRVRSEKRDSDLAPVKKFVTAVTSKDTRRVLNDAADNEAAWLVMYDPAKDTFLTSAFKSLSATRPLIIFVSSKPIKDNLLHWFAENKPGQRVFIYNTEKYISSWARDRVLAVVTSQGPKIILPKLKKNTRDPLRQAALNAAEDYFNAAGVAVEKSDVIFEGGNILSNGEDIFVGENMIEENMRENGWTETQVREQIARLLGSSLPIYTIQDPFNYHLDSFMTLLPGKKIVVGDPKLGVEQVETDPNQKAVEHLYAWHRDDLEDPRIVSFEKTRALTEKYQLEIEALILNLQHQGFMVQRVPLILGRLGNSGKSAYPIVSYNNVLIEGNKVLLPWYDIAADAYAKRIFEGLGYQVEALGSATAAMIDFGCARCLFQKIFLGQIDFKVLGRLRNASETQEPASMPESAGVRPELRVHSSQGEWMPHQSNLAPQMNREKQMAVARELTEGIFSVSYVDTMSRSEFRASFTRYFGAAQEKFVIQELIKDKKELVLLSPALVLQKGFLKDKKIMGNQPFAVFAEDAAQRKEILALLESEGFDSRQAFVVQTEAELNIQIGSRLKTSGSARKLVLTSHDDSFETIKLMRQMGDHLPLSDIFIRRLYLEFGLEALVTQVFGARQVLTAA